jgi:hypothetical protein
LIFDLAICDSLSIADGRLVIDPATSTRGLNHPSPITNRQQIDNQKSPISNALFVVDHFRVNDIALTRARRTLRTR